MELARSTQKPYLSEPFEIVQGKLGYSLMIPYLNDSFFEIVFTADTVFNIKHHFG